jgi:transcriptional regulator with XRE-family HTH domain
LGRELKHLREFAGFNGRDLAAGIRDSGLDMSQSKVSRIESGAVTVTRPEVQAWADVTELIHAVARIADPEDVELYRGLYDRLRERAARGPDAVALIQRIAAELRG